MTAKGRIQRRLYIDVIKGLSIILVVFIHFNNLSDSTVIGNAVMQMVLIACPCFMMASGSVMNRYVTVSGSYIKGIIHVYLMLTIWKLVYFLIIRYLFHNNAEFAIGDFIRYLFLFRNYPGMDTGLFWYINAYILCLIAFPMVKACDGKLRGALLLIVFAAFIGTDVLNYFSGFLTGGKVNFDGLRLVLPFTNQSMLFFFILGMIADEKLEAIHRFFIKDRKRVVIPFLMIVLGVFGDMWLKYKTSSLWNWGDTSITATIGFQH